MKLWSNSFVDGAVIPGNLAFCLPDPARHVCLGGNCNPHLAWAEVPPDTASLALLCHDPDVPSSGEDVNKEGRTVPASLPRTDFFHWVLIDLPPDLCEIGAGEFSSAVTPRGKSAAKTLYSARQGINDYTGWFADDQDMRGDYHGYDGPCPPWNDEIPHRYIFTLYALDLATLPLEGKLTGSEVRNAIAGHVLAEASLTGIYSLNPALDRQA